MKVPISWLKEYVDFDITADKVAEVLTLAGLEVDKVGPVLEISLTPNLGHCMSIFGVARELAAHLKTKVKKPEAFFAPSAHEMDIKVIVEDKTHCPRYACRVVRDVVVEESPKWLKEKLQACGVKSINNLVDISNYVLLELGQPLHIFDYDKIEDKTIIVKSGASCSSFIGLDDQEYQTDKDTLFICDTKKGLAMAGILGGKSSAVTENTKNILIESAYFTPGSIRKSSKRMGLRTDASDRFEKGIDPEGIVFALDRAASLIKGEVSKELIDVKSHPILQKTILLRQNRVNHILGTHLSLNEITSCLERLEMHARPHDENSVSILIPSYRNDITKEIDLIEEVARVYGYNNIPKKVPYFTSSKIPSSAIYLFETEVRTGLMGQGLTEFLTCDLMSENLAALSLERGFTTENLIRVLCPSNTDQSVLRASLLPGLLQAAKYNLDHQNKNVSAFEVGKIHFKDKDQFREYSCAGIIMTGKRAPYHFDPKPKEVDFFDLKGILENLLQSYPVRFEASHFHHFHPKAQAKMMIGDCTIGMLGEIHPREIREFGADQQIFFAEINLHELLPYKKQSPTTTEISPFPSSERDWTFTLSDEVHLSTIIDAIYAQKSPLLEKILLLDLYKSDKIGKDRGNITLRFVYRDREKTISFETVEKEHANIISHVKNTRGIL